MSGECDKCGSYDHVETKCNQQCEWKFVVFEFAESNDEGYWVTGCDDQIDNPYNFKFCPYCGKEIKISETDSHRKI
jgi:hypothetical protein